jgi:hypothetical protein
MVEGGEGKGQGTKAIFMVDVYIPERANFPTRDYALL